MDTFQAVIFGIIHGFTEFLPVSVQAHLLLPSYFLGWPEPSHIFLGALAFAGALSIFIYFINDWASQLSALIQVVIYRKKPMTLDERMPFFIFMAALPSTIGWYYLREPISTLPALDRWPLILASTVALLGIPLSIGERWSRKNKALPDWNWLDAIIIGFLQILAWIPGCGRTTLSLSGALFRNYSREAAAKFSFFVALPLLGAQAFLGLRELDFHSSIPTEGMTWSALIISTIVAFLCGLLAIGGFMKNVQKKPLGRYMVYRILVGVGLAVGYWVKNRAS